MADNVTMPAELVALLAAFGDTPPTALTSCPGWTAHHIAAHIGGNYEEVRQHVEAFAQGRPLERTRGWEEREQPLRELDYATLLRRVEKQAVATAAVVVDVSAEQPNAELLWTKRMVPIAGFLTHMRSEDALHRWDLVGDDETSTELLGQQDLLNHAVKFIGQPLLQRGLRANAAKEMFTARVRCPELDDLILDLADEQVHLSIGHQVGEATIEGDPAARLLLLWGRKPAPFSRLQAVGSGASAARAQSLFAGY